MKTSTIIWIIIIILIILGVWWYVASNTGTETPVPPSAHTAQNAQHDSEAASSANAAASSSESMSASSTAPMTAEVTLTANGFSPASVTIAKGGTVTWKDTSGGSMWIASNVHPNHTDYDGTSRSQHCAPGYTGPTPFDQCGTGTTYSFTFDQTGTWTYHNHRQSSQVGTVIVK